MVRRGQGQGDRCAPSLALHPSLFPIGSPRSGHRSSNSPCVFTSTFPLFWPQPITESSPGFQTQLTLRLLQEHFQLQSQLVCLFVGLPDPFIICTSLLFIILSTACLPRVVLYNCCSRKDSAECWLVCRRWYEPAWVQMPLYQAIS